ncbi:MAG TPA: hypothetical protein VMB22_06835 [Verrucomicrobiae bacterium]|nr:hypothetical protein [Verrucomicrobiae bacterium]
MNSIANGTNEPAKKTISGFDAASQSNIDVIASGNMDDEVPCPPEYANVVSNTNLFTLDEQKLLNGIPSGYENVTTNSGPPGTVLVGLYNRNRNKSGRAYWNAYFQFTNSGVRDEAVFMFGTVATVHHIRNKAGDGFDLNIGGRALDSDHIGTGVLEYSFCEIKHNVRNGLSVYMHGDHCMQWMCYSNGMAVDKWLDWSADGSKLILWAKFKKPYDISKYELPSP